MSDFLDFDALESDSKDANIIPHPLRDKLSESEKASYIRVIVFAGLADDDTLSDIELEYGRTRALSLGLNADEFDEAVKTVQSLGGQQERMKFLREMLTAFTDRAVAMYVLCDMAQAMVSDGELTDNASKFLDSLYRLLLKSENKPDNPLSSADQKFLADYRPFLAPGKTADASEIVQAAAQNDFDFPSGLVTYFTPELKAVALEGGVRAERKYSICAGKFSLETELTIGKDTEFVLRDAEITFGPKARLVLSGAKIVIENCKFIAAESKTTDETPSWFEMINCNELTECEFKTCTFNGGKIRTAIATDSTRLNFTNCKFSEFKVSDKKSDNAVILSWSTVTCRGCDFSQCHCVHEGDRSNALIKASSFELTHCNFTDCSSDRDLFRWYGYNHSFRFEKCKLTRCFASGAVVGYYADSTGCQSWDGFFECRIVDSKYYKLVEGSYSCYNYTAQINLTEDEFQKALEEADDK